MMPAVKKNIMALNFDVGDTKLTIAELRIALQFFAPNLEQCPLFAQDYNFASGAVLNPNELAFVGLGFGCIHTE
jgi:hypothetical protein